MSEFDYSDICVVGEKAEYIVKYTGEALQLLPDIMQKLVRCKDCKYGIRKNTNISNMYECGYPYTIVQESHFGDFFCANAKPKDGEQE